MGDEKRTALAEYRRWNNAIAAEVFGPEAAGRPVYLDLEEDVLERIGRRVGFYGQDPGKELARVVRSTLDLKVGPAGVFRAHTDELEVWRALNFQTVEAPPVVGVLAVMSLAAEAMGAMEHLASTSYHGPLRVLLEVDLEDEADRLELAFRKVAEPYWDALNLWVDAGDGERGIPTAYALPPRKYVGLAISQSLVRSDDRKRFQNFFRRYGLVGGDAVGAAELEPLLEDWLRDEHGGSSATFRRLWRRSDGELRSKIASVAAGELELWQESGRPAPDGPAPATNARLTALARTGLRRQVEFGLQLRSPDFEMTVDILTPSGDVLGQADFVADAPGYLRAAVPGLLDQEALLGGLISLQESGGNTTFRHQHRSLYVFLRDDVMQGFVERERIVLAVDAIVVAADRLADRAADLLGKIARPGFTKHSSADIVGLPDGWHIFLGVQVMHLPAPEEQMRLAVDLNPLIPAATSQLTISGGLSLPGLTRRWSSLQPPEVRASVEQADSAVLSLTCVRALAAGPLPPPVSVETEDGALVHDLAGLDLPDGDYELLLALSNGRGTQRRTLRLRSGEHRAEYHSGGPAPLGYFPWGDPLAPISASEGSGGDLAVRGAQVSGATALKERPPVPEATWPTERKHRRRDPNPEPARIRLGVPDPESCFVTGRHYFEVPEATGRKPTSMLAAECRNCTFVKRFPAGYAGMIRRKGRRTRSAGPPVAWSLPAVNEVGIDWSASVDALFHLRGGPSSHLEHIAHQLEPTALFVSRFARDLETAAEIDVARDPRRLTTSAWAASPGSLAEAEDGSWRLVGARSPSIISRLIEVARSCGAVVIVEGGRDTPPLISVTDADEGKIRVIASSLDDVSVEPAAGRAMLSVLPPLSMLLPGLPVIPMPAARRVNIWDPGVALWTEAKGAGGPGSYQLQGQTVRYGVRLDEDVAAGTMRLADPRVVKHLGALLSGKPLIVFDEEKGLLVTPLGADLPGLYGRAVVLASGRLPVPDEKAGALVYPAVSPVIAREIAHLLLS